MGMFESTYPVWGSATPCKILFIGEAPGEVEDRNKKPFTGASGTLLQKILNEEGVSEYGFTNLVKCFPKDKKVDAKALKICGDYLREDLKRCSPNVVVALGKAVYSHLSGKSRSIQQVRGTVFYSQEFGVKVVPMIHPSAIFKTPGCEALIRQDLKRVVKESQTRELGKIVGNYVVLSDFESFQKFKQEIEQCQEFAFDIETDSTDFINGHILGIGFSFRPNEGYYIGLLDRGKKVWSGDEEQAIWQFLRDIFSSDKSKVGQNCLQGEVKVLMADGTKKKISEIVNKKITAPVLSYNASTGKVEPKRITGWFKESDKTVKWKKLITENSIDGYFGKQAARYTHNHKVFIGGRGFTPIYDVRVGDRILTAVPELSEIQQQVILGSLLGDGSLRLQKTQKAKNPLFSVAHSDKQKDYLEWKELILKNISMGVTVQKNNRGFNTRKDALLYKFFTKSLPCLHSLYDKFFKVGKKEVSLELLYGLTPIALAVWFMDDGSSHKNTLYLHTCGLSENSVENVVSYFRDKYGIFFKKRKRNNLYAGKVGFDLSVCQSKGGYKFMELVAPYIIPSMQYKIPKYFEGTVGGCLGEIGKQEFRESSYTTITAIIDAPFKKGEHKSKFVKYCMEVDGNHNFFTTMGLVSNSKFDTKFLNQAGIQVTNVTFDTMLASHLIDEESPHGLKDLANLYLDVCGYDEVIGDYDEEFHKIPIEDLGRYCAIDCDCTLRLKHIFEAELKKYDLLYKLFINLVMPFQDVIKDTEFIGVKVDRKYLEGLITTYRQRVLELNTRFTALVGRKINIASPKQLAELFYKEYKFEPTKKTEGGANSIDEEVLEGLAHKSEVAKVVLEYRKSVKTLNTFLEPMQSLLDTNDRLHTNYLLHGTATGRTSSASPNLQNIPNTKEIRKMFIADGGCKFLIVDYSQLELRILAKYSKDSRLVGAFVNGEDVHSTTASAIFGVPLAEVGKEQRSVAKCFHPDTEVLTQTGWKTLRGVSLQDTVAQAVPQDGKVFLEWVKPTYFNLGANPHKDLVELKCEGINLAVTPNHRMLYQNRGGNFLVTSPEAFNTVRYWWNAGIMSGGEELDETILRLAIATQADGSISRNAKTEDGWCHIRFGFTKKRKIERLRLLLKGREYHTAIHKNGKNPIVTAFTIKGVLAKKILSHLDDDKTLSWKLLNASQKSREAILDEVQYWDSHKAKNWQMYLYFSSKKKNIDVLQAIAAITNRKSKVGTDETRLTIRAGTRSRGGNISIKRFKHDEVASISVPSTFVLVRHGGIPLICGQSVNFGLVYGQGAEGLSHELGITKAEAQSHIDTFFLKFSSVRNWMDDYKKKAMELLYVENMFGRRRRIRPKAEISNKAKWGGDNKSMSLNDRQIINSPIQGCLVGTTHIYEKKQGYICLHDVVGKTIELWDGDRFVRGTVVFAGKKQEVVIKFKNGQSIVCSPDHKFLTIDVHGIETWKTPKEFRSLTLVRISKAVEGDKIFWNGIPNGTAEVANVTETESFVEMYDVVNTDSGKFMANGLIVHNSGGDLTSFASVVVAKRLKEAGLTGRMVLTVHDELVLEVKESEMEATEKIVREVMTRPFGERTNSVMGGIPLEIGVDIEPHWI